MKKITLLLYYLCFTTFLLAQEKDNPTKPFNHELGLNVTNLLTDLLGNNNRTDPGDYLITYKKVTGNKAFRLGLTARFSIKDENNNNFNNTLTNQNFQIRMGKENRYNLSSKFQYYMGGDAILGFKSEQTSASVITSGGSNFIIQTDRNIVAGGGPVLGFQYALLDRLLIGTEGAVYAAFNRSSVDFKVNNGISTGGTPFPSKKTNGIDVQTHLPKFLFLIVKF